jgi:hypothetical protein
MPPVWWERLRRCHETVAGVGFRGDYVWIIWTQFHDCASCGRVHDRERSCEEVYQSYSRSSCGRDKRSLAAKPLWTPCLTTRCGNHLSKVGIGWKGQNKVGVGQKGKNKIGAVF